MFDYNKGLFHVGIPVPDLEAAMSAMGAGLGVQWAEVVERDQPLWTPEDGAYSLPQRFTYTCAGPQHVELFEGPPGSVWDGRGEPGVHHMGVWVDDVAHETERLIAEGWTLELAHRSPEDGYGSMTYLRSPKGGYLLEFVTSSARPAFERWWAGASL